MNRQFRSDNPRRLQRLRDQQPIGKNGIDFVEITSPDQRSLRVVCVHPVVGITRAHLRLDGGVRVTGIGLAADPMLTGREIRLEVTQAGDFSWYTLSLIDPANPDAPAPGFDICLSSLRFNFKAGCPSEFDCAEGHACPPVTPPAPRLDYLAKDYDSLRRLMLDRLSQSMPGFTERSPADFTVALVEMLAYVGDHLSYTQDAVATEAYLGTARRRTSLRRHARLLDYPLHDGCNARVFVTFDVAAAADGGSLPAGRPLLALTDQGGPVRDSAILDQLPQPGIEVFETLHDLVLHAAHSEIALHDFADPACCLPRGTTAAALVHPSAPAPALALAVGDLLIFEEIRSPTTGQAADRDTRHRHPVRLTAVQPGRDDLTGTDLLLVRWHPDDALPFPLCVSQEFEVGGALVKRAIAVARGNVVLADHGMTRPWQAMEPPEVGDGGTPALRRPYRPRLKDTGLAFAEPYDHDVAAHHERPLSARRTLDQAPRQARPAGLRLQADPGDPNETPWTPQRDLLGSDRFAREFVVETENDGSAWLRFGAAPFGAAPSPGKGLLARYRLGGGPQGNVGAEAINTLVLLAGDDARLTSGIRGLRNPLSAQGGAEPETLDTIRLNAPEAFRTQERAVTADDYARAAERHPDVQRAAARLRWTGSWHTVFLMLDRRGGQPVDAAFKATLRTFLERFRLAGHDLEFADPVQVPLDLQLQVCVARGHFASDVKAALLRAFTAGLDPQGQRGFFHPDRYTFGTPLYLSAVVATAMAVAGVASVSPRRFQRWGRSAKGELAAGVITPSAQEVLRADGDPNFPENGQISFIVEGGS